MFDPSRPSKLNHFNDNKFFLRVELLHAPTPPHVTISESAFSADTLKEEVRQSYPLSKFKKVQTKLYQINNVLSGQASFLHVQFGGQHTCLASMTLHSALTDFRFIVLAAPLAPKKAKEPVIKAAKGKKRVVALNSDSDEDEAEEEKNTSVNKRGLYLEHGYFVKNKKQPPAVKAGAQSRISKDPSSSKQP